MKTATIKSSTLPVSTAGSRNSVVNPLQLLHTNNTTTNNMPTGNPLQFLEDRPNNSIVTKGVVQRVTLKVGSAKDEADFAAAQPLMEAYLGETPKKLEDATIDDVIGRQLNIWGHMSDSQVGNMTHNQLALALIGKGYRSSAEIRMIGCNVRRAPTTSPRLLWHGLYNKLSTMILAGHKPSVPTIYATKGPLYTGKENMDGGKHFFVPGGADDGEMAIRNTYADLIEEKYTMIDEKLQKYNSTSREEAIEQLKKASGSVPIKDYDAKLAAKIKEIEENNEKYVHESYGYGITALEKEMEAKVHAYHEQTQAEKEGGQYPSIFKQGEGAQDGKWVWNDVAWTSYKGATE